MITLGYKCPDRVIADRVPSVGEKAILWDGMNATVSGVYSTDVDNYIRLVLHDTIIGDHETRFRLEVVQKKDSRFA